LDLAASSVGDESGVSLAYLEWVMEDAVFVMELAAARKASSVG
jgi:hypothetical protein